MTKTTETASETKPMTEAEADARFEAEAEEANAAMISALRGIGANKKRRGWALTEALIAPAKDGRFY